MDALILDIDGTLWDSTAIVAQSWNQVLDTHTEVAFRATPEKLKNLFGRTLYEIAAIIFPELTTSEQQKLIGKCCESEHEYLSRCPGIIFEGVVETIKKLAKQYKVCIVSNCEAGYIELVMKALGIDEDITDYECPGYTGRGKGYNIKLVMERNGFASAIYVGDTQGDLAACRQASLPFVYCKYGFGQPLEWDFAIDRFEELLELCPKIEMPKKKLTTLTFSERRRPD